MSEFQNLCDIVFSIRASPFSGICPLIFLWTFRYMQLVLNSLQVAIDKML